MADTMGIAKAQAVGGPSAAAEYAAGQSGANSAAQQALSGIASRAGALDAPAAFGQNQASLFAPALHAQGAALGADAGAAGAYSGAINSAVGAYGANIQSPEEQAALHLQAQLAARSAEQDAVVGLHRYYSAIQSGQTQQASQYNKMLAEQKQQALDNAATMAKKGTTAGGGGMTPDTYDNFADVLKKSKDLPTAVEYLNNNLAKSVVTDSKGNPVLGPDGKPQYQDAQGNKLDLDPDLVKSMLLTAYGASPDFNKLVAQNGIEQALYLTGGQYGGLSQQGSDNPTDVMASLISALGGQ